MSEETACDIAELAAAKLLAMRDPIQRRDIGIRLLDDVLKAESESQPRPITLEREIRIRGRADYGSAPG